MNYTEGNFLISILIASSFLDVKGFKNTFGSFFSLKSVIDMVYFIKKYPGEPLL